jgi:environmental stress-induced protein Ves
MFLKRMQIIRQSAFKAVPWKNGGGITHEAIRVPPSGDPFRWRVSVAHIDASGSFSEFAAYDRTMVLLRGGGIVLGFSNGDRRVLEEPGDMVQFDGALAAECTLLHGPCVDLNLIAAKTLQPVEARVQRLDQPLAWTLSEHRSTLLFPIDAPLDLQVGGERAVLEPWDLAVIGGPALWRAARLDRRAPDAPASVFLATLPEG